MTMNLNFTVRRISGIMVMVFLINGAVSVQSYFAASAYSQKKEEFVHVEKLIEVLKTRNVDRIVETLVAVLGMDYKGGILPLIRDLWDERKDKYPELPWKIINSDIVRVYVADILVQAGKNGHIEIDMQPIHDFVWKLIDDIDNRDAFVVRMAISSLISFDEESDVDRVLSIAKQQKKATFQTSVMALSYMCNKKARKALEWLFEHEKKTEFKEYLGKMIRKSGDFNKRSGRCSKLFK